MTDLGFIHRFVPGSDARAPVLLLLHGTGGDENDLIPLGRELLPGAAILGVRGNVLENGMPRFFRRLAEGVFDLPDLERRTAELAGFIENARRAYGLAENALVAVGYSNGANIAASLILRDPPRLSAAVLFRAMVPFTPDAVPGLGGMPIFLSAGQTDPIVPGANTRQLAKMFESGGAHVFIHWHDGGHELGSDDIQAARLWLARQNFVPDVRTE
ncbi:MAG TPA: alpha/beta hydrolase [Bryobacteraceae bacterium]|jgi:predicted esterase